MPRCRQKPIPIHELGSLQARLMRVLWRRGESAVHDLRGELAAELPEDRLPAYITILTVMNRLEKRGLVAHRREGRRFVYRPVVTKMAIEQAMLREVVLPLFGSRQALVASVRAL